jgi:hypothetical protein
MLPALTNEHSEILNRSIGNDWSVPEYKLKHFVAGSHIHPLHKVRQYMMELNSRQENLEAFERDFKRMTLEIELAEEKKLVAQFEAEKKLFDLDIAEKKHKIMISKEKYKSACKDRDKIFKLIEEFNASPEGKDENGILYMDLMKDPEAFERIEKDYWEYRLAKQASLDMIAYGRIGVGNMEAILQLDPDSQNKSIAMAYELLIMNENRMTSISDKVQERIKRGQTVSDIHKLVGISKSEFFVQLENQEKQDVPLIQKR